MTIKRAPPHFVLNNETRRKFVALASLFVHVDKRNRKKAKRKKNEKTKITYKDIGLWASRPLEILSNVKPSLTADIVFDIICICDYLSVKQGIST